MLTKYCTVVLILQALAGSFAVETTEIIDTELDLVNAGGAAPKSYYVLWTSQIPPDWFPENVTSIDRKGFWVYSSTKPAGSSILFRVYSTIQEISLTYYNTNDLDVSYQDIAAPDSVPTNVVLKSSVNEEWTTTKFPLARNFVDTQIGVIFNFTFRENSAEPPSFLLLDSISVTSATEDQSTTPSKSSMAVPTLTTIFTVISTAVIAAILKQ